MNQLKKIQNGILLGISSLQRGLQLLQPHAPVQKAHKNTIWFTFRHVRMGRTTPFFGFWLSPQKEFFNAGDSKSH